MSALSTVNSASQCTGAAARRVAELRDIASRIVGTTFYGTLLRTLRDSGVKGEYGHGGRGEEVFQAQLDQIYAEQAGRARGSDLTEALVAKFEGRVRALARAATDGGDES